MVEAFIGAARETLIKEVISLIPKVKGLDKTDQLIRECLQSFLDVHDVFKDHEEMNCTDRNGEVISSLKDLTSFANDLTYIFKMLSKQSQRGILSWIKMVRNPDSTLDEELKAVSRRLQHMYKRKMMLDKDKESDEKRTRPMAGPASAEHTMFGRISEIEKIFDLLERPSDGDYGFNFISIVGIGGIGKTTLAQHIYNDDRVAYFPVRAWCHVSINFNPNKIYRSIIEQLTGKCDIHDSSAMIEKLRRELKGKKFLIVLDDYWSESVHDLNALRGPFMTAEPGSIFLVTTRDRAVAKRFAGAERTIDLR